MAEIRPGTPALVEVENLHYAYRSHYALRGVSFRVQPRSIHGFVGPNGAGKTTMLKILATLLKPHHGRARLFGLDLVRDYKQVRRRIGFMPDHFSMYRQMTVSEYLDFFAAAYGLDLKQRDAVISDVLQLTDMEGRRDELIRGLSRGMQQRVNLARVLVHDPDLLLLDEPASGLDPRARIELMEILRELARMGKTVFVSSHILSELEEMCDSVTIVDRGAVRYSGSMAGLAQEARRLSADGHLQAYVLRLEEASEPAWLALSAIEGVLEVGAAPASGAGDEKTGSPSRAPQETPEAGPADYRIVFDPQRTGPNAVLTAAIGAGARVVSFTMDTLRLGQAFMQLTQPGVTE